MANNSSKNPLERLPPEILDHISEKLAFFDKKSLQLVSKQIYYLTGPLTCPDPLSWIMHICWTAYKTGVYDYSVIDLKKTAEILKAMVEQLGPHEENEGTIIFGQALTRSVFTKAQAVPMDYCSKDIWYPYFFGAHSGAHGDVFQDGLHYATLGIFMLHHIRVYFSRACLERRSDIEQDWGSIECWDKEDLDEVRAWHEANGYANSILEVLKLKGYKQRVLMRWGYSASLMKLD